MKILSVVGARPQFVKEAVVGHELHKAGIDEILVHTGQHYDINMSDVFFKYLEIKEPDYYLGVGSGTHAYQTGTVMMELEKIIVKERPDYVLVYGDTNATIAGALTASKLKIPVAHVEAGLRQEPKDMPEEINRVITDHISSLLFCPTEKAVSNLKNEGISNGVHFVGDVMYDLFLKTKQMVDVGTILKHYDIKSKKYIVATVHRDFNTDNKSRLENILGALEEINKHIPIVFPVHPRTKKAIHNFEFDHYLGKIKTIDPVSYHDMVALLCGSKCVVTDSGGLQKEAYFAGVSATVLMSDTGWIELVESGWNRLVDANKNEIVNSILNLNSKSSCSFYGNGKAGFEIVKLLK